MDRGGMRNASGKSSKSIATFILCSPALRPTRSVWPSFANLFTAWSVPSAPTSRRTKVALLSSNPGSQIVFDENQ